MRYRILSAVLAAFCCFGSRAAAAPQTDEALKQIADRYWDAAMAHSPTWATALGDYRFNDRLDDFSESARKQWQDTLNGFLGELRNPPARTMSDDGRLTRKLLERTIRDQLLRMECRPDFVPLDQLSGSHLRLPLILVSQPFGNAKDFESYIERLRGFPKQVTDLISNMRGGMRMGFVPPRLLIEKVAGQIRQQLTLDAKQTVFYSPVAKMDVLDAADRSRITHELIEAIESDVIPGYLQLLGFVEDEYLPACRSTVGLSAIPRGEQIYGALAYLHTTIHLSPDEIHQTGLDEVKRIRQEMDRIRQEVKFSGDLDAFIAHMRTDPKFRFQSSEELFKAAEKLLNKTKPLMNQLFGRLPKADCVMKEIEPFRAASAPVAYYNPSPEDGSRPGYYYINTHAPTERLRFTLEALTYHEAIPGHHLQYALDQENSSIPKFQRYGRFNAFGEGWALYTEKLGYDIGGYQTPYSRFGQLTFEMWRACRLVVDTGMHVKGWSRQQAIDLMTVNTSLAVVDIAAEIDRYIAWPGQALSYKIGAIRIERLRKKAEEQLGGRFDLRKFHDALLARGAMPIDMLEQRMENWIEAQAR